MTEEERKEGYEEMVEITKSELTRLRALVARVEDVKGIKAQINKYIADEMSNGYANFRPIGCARAVRDYVLGEG